MGFQTKHQVPHTVTGCELTEDHAKHLIPTRKCSDFLVSVVLCLLLLGKAKNKIPIQIVTLKRCLTMRYTINSKIVF